MSIFAKEHFQFQFPPNLSNKKNSSFTQHSQQFVRPRKISHQINPVGPKFIIDDPEFQNGLKRQPVLSQKNQSQIMSNSTSDCGGNKYTFSDVMSHSSVLSSQEQQVKSEMSLSHYLTQKVYELKRRATISTSSDIIQTKIDKTKSQMNISDFKIIKLLGKGTFSFVYLAYELNLRFLCVLKTINKEKVKKMKCQEMIVREIKLQIRLNHPNIVKAYGYFCDQENVYIIQQYFGQKNLQKVLKKRGPIQEKKIKNIIRQISKGVQYLHHHNILHRDLKLENILTCNGTAKICDFGCAIETTVPRNTMVGSIPYLSPQQVKYQKYGKKKDIWSIGIMVHQLLFAYSPFEKQIAQNLSFPLGQRRFPKFNTDKIKDKIEKNKQQIDFLTKILQENEIIRMNIQQVLSHPFLNQ